MPAPWMKTLSTIRPCHAPKTHEAHHTKRIPPVHTCPGHTKRIPPVQAIRPPKNLYPTGCRQRHPRPSSKGKSRHTNLSPHALSAIQKMSLNLTRGMPGSLSPKDRPHNTDLSFPGHPANQHHGQQEKPSGNTTNQPPQHPPGGYPPGEAGNKTLAGEMRGEAL